MPSIGGPGKTAPKLLHDFLQFDPLRSPPNANYLADVTPPVGEGQPLQPAQNSCKHEYTPKWSQSVAPPIDSRPQDGAEYKIAVVCKKCRVHADIHIYYPPAVNPCPNEDYPLHHFRRHELGDEVGHTRIVYAWQCTAFQCAAQLRISFRRPRLEPADIALLTDTDRLRRRYEAVVEDEPEREGLRQATPIEALSRLRRYIKDALNTEHTRRSFPANNKRFIEAYGVRGQECADLLNKLGFNYEHPDWKLPQPPVPDDRLRASGDSLREYLEDFQMELLALVSRLAADANSVNPFAAEGWSSAERDIERLLAAQGSPTDKRSYFASLGALPDFADSLVEFAYDRQSLCHPEQRPYYFESLQVIAENRNTEQLQVKVATLASEDIVSRRDLSAAYRNLQVTASDDDERVLNLYHVLISDAGPSQQDDARQALYKIGLARGSQRLIKAAQQTMDTYEDALAWLGNGANKDTADDMLLSLVAVKTGDSKSNDELAQKAISIIARERKSEALNSWLVSGTTGGYEMTPEEALRHFGFEGKISDIDRSVLTTTIEFARQDRPSEQTDKAIAALQKAMAIGAAAKLYPAETWPAGLESHGNTCYLNSLLQYYFSVAPLRNIVLNYDDYKLDTTKYHEKHERVGYLNISMVEIKGGQRFAEDMKHLFERMIKSPSDKVRPEEDLVCRAFLNPKDYALLASSVKEENAAQGPQTNGLESAVDSDVTDESKGSATIEDRHQSDASSVTLQAGSENGEGADVAMKDTDLPPTPPDSGAEDKDNDNKPALPPRKFSTVRERALSAAKEKATQQQDVSDVHEKIMWRLQAGMTPKGQDEFGEQRDAIRELFEVVYTDTPVENGVEGTPKLEIRTSIQLGVPIEDTNLYAMLDAVTDQQPPIADAAAKKGVEVYKTFRSLPPVLQINIPRIMQDPITGAPTKSKACVKFEDELYMDRYCEQSGSEVLQKRKACWGWRKRLHALKKEQKVLSSCVADLDGAAALEEAAKYLNTFPGINDDLESMGIDGFDVDRDLQATLAADAEAQKSRLSVIENEIQALESQLKDEYNEKDLKYRLAAVMVHRGGSGSGHYFTYIRDFGNDLWRTYNDEKVTQVTNLNEIYEARTWLDGTPAFAVYVRDDKKSELIQPVCRAPEKLPTPEPSEPIASGWDDITMENGESQAGQPTVGIDPKLTMKEGGEEDWDEQRQVPKVNW
ncbi:hypothetical protein M409DRAFT_66774 [Zasmidium cellare ATCC 36951]|uniref:ubiquitinyl hydrolase 1 n=1 Tax=Zasmidium cellare ATCC 36951 TaxID=1080233 RepID=A0A6A6CI90_ZASCE|nr:uncharacterized protein M409DRAFT_66774 [Zasmidium cellare ATCC 36951]KAF2166323.1 hypothetical protein M409DRAFT_66774 [Zasmidium cellare ATCC 36951]